MNLLFVAPRMPYPPTRGGEITLYNFIKGLAGRHRVSLITFYDDEKELEYRSFLLTHCRRVELVRRRGKYSPAVFFELLLAGKSYGWARHYSPEFSQKVREIVTEENIELVQVETYLMAQYKSSFARCPMVLDMHNTTWLIWERMSANLSFPLNVFATFDGCREKRDELAACRAADVSVAVSEADRLLLLSETGAEVDADVVTPGVDTEYLTPQWRIVSQPSLVFVGSMDYVPNIDAMQYFCRDVLPLIAEQVSGVRLTIVGKPTLAIARLAESRHVTLAGYVSDVRTVISESAVSIVPLRIGGGIRMKILEAMALGSAIVSTSIGCEGLNLKHEAELLIADTPAAFAAAVIRLLENAALRTALGRRARQAAVDRFSWAQSVARLESVHQRALQKRPQIPA